MVVGCQVSTRYWTWFDAKEASALSTKPSLQPQYSIFNAQSLVRLERLASMLA